MTKHVAAAEYTDAELLSLFRAAMAEIASGGQSYMIGRRQYTAANLDEIRNQITWLETRVSTASSGLAMSQVELRRPC